MTIPENARFLKERGKAIWAAFEADDLPAGTQAMVHELARLADALDKLDAILAGRRTEWIKLIDFGDGELTLEVNGILGERRQNALAFTTMYRELRSAGVKETMGEKTNQGDGNLILRLVRDAG